ncbi:MAG: hypothetical protein Q9197_002446 [Variospora fuerteventurae]
MDMQQQQQPPPPQHPSSQLPSSQPVAQPDFGDLDNSSIDEQTLQVDMDACCCAYFDIAHYAMPILNQDKFLAALAQSYMPPHVASLSYAVASLAASLMDGYAHVKDKCYQIARKSFETCEREEDGANLMTIEALQACILITFYELRGKGFARAWMTLGRAIRLAQMMGLDRMDAPEPSVTGTLKFQQTLPPAQSQLDLEERRKAFWVLFIVDTYASVRTGTPVAIDQSKITTVLPSDPKAPETNLPPMPQLQNASMLYEAGYISSFTGLVLMVSLCRRCLNHSKLSLESESNTTAPGYCFWEQHYDIDKDLKNCTDAVIGKMDAQALLEDDFALALDMNLHAIDIFLHEAAIFRAGKDGLPHGLMTESSSRCSQAAMRIVNGVSLSQTLAEPKKALFKLKNIFAMWPVCMAMQVVDRQLSATNDNAELGHIVSMLRTLVAAIEDLEDVGGHWIGSISHILKRLEDIDPNSMRTSNGEAQGALLWDPDHTRCQTGADGMILTVGLQDYGAALPQRAEEPLKPQLYGEMVWKLDIDSLQCTDKLPSLTISDLVELSLCKKPGSKVLEYRSDYTHETLSRLEDSHSTIAETTDKTVESVGALVESFKHAKVQKLDLSIDLESQRAYAVKMTSSLALPTSQESSTNLDLAALEAAGIAGIDFSMPHERSTVFCRLCFDRYCGCCKRSRPQVS